MGVVTERRQYTFLIDSPTERWTWLGSQILLCSKGNAAQNHESPLIWEDLLALLLIYFSRLRRIRWALQTSPRIHI